MKRAYWPILFIGVCQGIATGTVGYAADRAAWQQWVYDETKEKSSQWPPELWPPGATAAIIQFGYDYCEQRDKREPHLDERTVIRLRPGVIRRAPWINSADGISFLDLAGVQAQRFLCP